MDSIYLNNSLLEKSNLDASLIPYSRELLNLPIKIIQFGEGNFIRAFFDYFIHKLNCNNLFNGRIAVLKPREGTLDKLRAQDCLFTLITAGIDRGKTIYEKEIITSIGKAIDTYDNWHGVLELSKDNNIKIIVSNTTERGIKFETKDKFNDSPPSTFPAKLTQMLYGRYSTDGNADGFIIIPLELIKDNGEVLESIVLKYAELWTLGDKFKEWIKNKNLFVNTLVDRIVPGYPISAAEQIFNEIGYRDNYLTFAECYHLFAIEETNIVSKNLPLKEIGLNVIFSDDISIYRDLKLKILNGAHTAMVGIAVLKKVHFVKDIFTDQKLNNCINKIIFNEIISTLTYEKDVVLNFANDVLERFKNPFIEHKWADIFMNSITKFQIRVFPTINKYYQLNNTAPHILCFSYALLIYLFKDSEWKDDNLICKNNNIDIIFSDDKDILFFLHKLWNDFKSSFIKLDDFIGKVVNNKNICSINSKYAKDFECILKRHLSNLDKQNFDKYFEVILRD